MKVIIKNIQYFTANVHRKFLPIPADFHDIQLTQFLDNKKRKGSPINKLVNFGGPKIYNEKLQKKTGYNRYVAGYT